MVRGLKMVMNQRIMMLTIANNSRNISMN